MALTDRQYRFVIEYCKDFVAIKAAERVGYSVNGSDSIASTLMAKPEVQDAIQRRKEELAAVARLTPEYILREVIGIIETDRRICCRCCYGTDHLYQWTEAEYMRALKTASRLGNPAPEFMGGFGFIKGRAPNPECPECHGEGVLASTDELKKADKIKALELAAKLGGMIVDRKEIAGPGGGSISVTAAIINLGDLSDEQLAIIAARGGNNGGTSELPVPIVLEANQLPAGSNP